MTPEELGSLLFSCAVRWASLDAEKSEFPESVRADTLDTDRFTKELLIVIMYAAVNVVMRKIRAQDTAYRVLDAMNNAFINRWKPEDRHQIQVNIGIRYNEYEDAQSEERGPNQLWPLSHHILKHLLGKDAIGETQLDAVTITFLANYYSAKLLAFNELVENVGITR